VQAIAIPAEIHEQLQLNGISDAATLDSLLQNQFQNALSVSEETPMKTEEETLPLNAIINPSSNTNVNSNSNMSDDQQLLEVVPVENTPLRSKVRKVTRNGHRAPQRSYKVKGLKSGTRQRTVFEETPLYFQAHGQA